MYDPTTEEHATPTSKHQVLSRLIIHIARRHCTKHMIYSQVSPHPSPPHPAHTKKKRTKSKLGQAAVAVLFKAKVQLGHGVRGGVPGADVAEAALARVQRAHADQNTQLVLVWAGRACHAALPGRGAVRCMAGGGGSG